MSNEMQEDKELEAKLKCWDAACVYFRSHTLHLACTVWNLPFCTSR